MNVSTVHSITARFTPNRNMEYSTTALLNVLCPVSEIKVLTVDVFWSGVLDESFKIRPKAGNYVVSQSTFPYPCYVEGSSHANAVLRGRLQ